MDYSDDACMDHFSPGQNALMNQMWNRYRAQGIPATTTVVVTTKTTTTLTTTTRSTTTKTSSTFTRTSTTTKPISTPTTGTGTGIITFALGASYPTIEGDLIQGVEARLSYDIDRMGGACPMLRYCYQFGWISPSVCGTVPVAKSNSIPITFNYYGTAYLSFESFDADNICATDSTGFRGYSVYVKMPNKN